MCATDGLPVGAFVAHGRHVDALRRALRKAAWLKAGINVTPYAEGDATGAEAAAALPDADAPSVLRAVHVTPLGAAAMAAGGAGLPTAIEGLLKQQPGESTAAVRWVPGLRVRSAACGFGRPATRPWAAVEVVGVASEGGDESGGSSGSDQQPFTYSELFAGIGGFRVALDSLGGRCVFASELDESAQKVYHKNFGDCPFGDILEIGTEEIGSHDVLTGGFPCQPFSNLGEKQGFADPRGQLFREIIRVIYACRPRAVILENVANLVYIDGGWPELPVLDTSLAQVLEGPEVDNDTQNMLSEEQFAKLQTSSEYMQDPEKRLAQLHAKARTLTSGYRGGIRSEFVFRVGAPRPRYFTVRECARLQGFPESFVHCGSEGLPDRNRAYHQLGNAVCPVVVAAIAACVLSAIGLHRGTLPSGAATSHGIEPLPRGPDPHRGLTASALELLLAASPTDTAESLQLRVLCEAFLLGGSSGVPSSTGCGRELSASDVEGLRRLLTSSLPGAQTTALFAIGRVAYLEGQTGVAKTAPAAVVASGGLLGLVTGCLAGANEVQRQAVTTLKILSTFESVVGPLARDACALQRLREFMQDAEAGGSIGRQAGEILQNLGVLGNGSPPPAMGTVGCECA
mmetsp:Transcript_118964/g.381178  ORF Transcript_118964/g.381178 Transcript_118964/m.381178 type:complete len:628 (-) Transcript_118964:246-2129(-)